MELVSNLIRMNPQNFRYWNIEYSHWIRDNKSRYFDKVNFWTGIIGDHLLNPFFINENLNSETFETMLIEQIILAIQNLS